MNATQNRNYELAKKIKAQTQYTKDLEIENGQLKRNVQSLITQLGQMKRDSAKMKTLLDKFSRYVEEGEEETSSEQEPTTTEDEQSPDSDYEE